MQDNSPDDGWVLYYALVAPDSSLAKEDAYVLQTRKKPEQGGGGRQRFNLLRSWIPKIRKSIITVPYKIKLLAEKEKTCKPIWTYVNDHDLIPFYNELGFFESPLRKTDPYKPDSKCRFKGVRQFSGCEKPKRKKKHQKKNHPISFSVAHPARLYCYHTQPFRP